MSTRRIGVAAMGGDGKAVLNRIVDLEKRGIPAAWLTAGGGGLDSLTVFAAAAARTERILLGTCIVPTWPRHPITTVSQTQVIASLAPGRFRLGLGPSHKPGMEATYHFKFEAPLTNLREYVAIVKALLRDGAVDFDGRHYHAHTRVASTAATKDVPVMASALRTGSFAYCGAETDGAITWVSPYVYIRDVALPTMRDAAVKAGRQAPPMVAHMPVCVTDDVNAVRAFAKQGFSHYPQLPFYAQMLADAGFPEAKAQKSWSDRAIDAVLVAGNERQVTARVKQIFDMGVDEVIAHPVQPAGSEAAAWERTVRLLADITGKV